MESFLDPVNEDRHKRYIELLVNTVRSKLTERARRGGGATASAVAQSVWQSFLNNHIHKVDLDDPGSAWKLLVEIVKRHAAKWDQRGRGHRVGGYTFNIELIRSAYELSCIRSEGKSLVIVGCVNQRPHIRIFDDHGKMIVDEGNLTEQASADLMKKLNGLWPPHKLTSSEKGQTITAVTAIVGHFQGRRVGSVSLDEPISSSETEASQTLGDAVRDMRELLPVDEAIYRENLLLLGEGDPRTGVFAQTLTRRQREVFAMRLAGKKRPEIVSILDITRWQVDQAWKEIEVKLDDMLGESA